MIILAHPKSLGRQRSARMMDTETSAFQVLLNPADSDLFQHILSLSSTRVICLTAHTTQSHSIGGCLLRRPLRACAPSRTFSSVQDRVNSWLSVLGSRARFGVPLRVECCFGGAGGSDTAAQMIDQQACPALDTRLNDQGWMGLAYSPTDKQLY